MRKRVLSMLCAVMMLCCMTGTAMAAEMLETVPEEAVPLTELLEQTTPEAAPTIYPAEVRASEENGIPRLEKVYYLTAKDDPATIPTADFEREGRTYTLLEGTLADDLFEARSVVEGAAARLAARNATPEDISAMEAQINAMEEAIPAYVEGKKRLADMLKLDDLFHLQCAAASHNEFYIQFVNIVHMAGTDMGLYEKTYGRQPEKYYDSVKFHRQLLDAIRERNEVLAQEIMCRHIDSVRSNAEPNTSEHTSI